MDIGNRARKIFKGFYSITDVAAWVGYVGITSIVLIVCIDVFGRYLLNKPLRGSYELVQMSMIGLSGFAVMYATVKRGHVALDLIIGRFSRRVQMIMRSIFSLLGFGISGSLAYGVYLLAFRDLKTGARTLDLQMITAPFTLMLVVAMFLCGLTLLIETFRPEASEQTSEGEESSKK